MRPCLLYTVLPLSMVLISCSKVAFCPSTMSTETKMRAQNEHRAACFHSCYFYYFLREYIDKTNKKVHNKFTSKYRHIQEHGSRGIRAEHRETGCESPTQNGTVRCMFFPTAQQRGHSGETGEGFAERTGESPRTKSGYSVPISTLGFPKGAVCSA